jgi:hypothetical protein
MEVVKNGVFIEEKIMPRNKCAICNSPLYMQVYHYDSNLTKVIACKKCKTYSHLKKPKKYNEFPEDLLKENNKK